MMWPQHFAKCTLWPKGPLIVARKYQERTSVILISSISCIRFPEMSPDILKTEWNKGAEDLKKEKAPKDGAWWDVLDSNQ